MEDEDSVLSTKEVMGYYHISRSTVQRMIVNGMPHTKADTRNVFPMQLVWAWFKASLGCKPFEWGDRVELSRDARLANRAFREFNAKFFRNRLSDYKVRVVESIPDENSGYDSDGLCDYQKKLILLHWDVVPAEWERRRTLLHEMCHAVAPQGSEHGWQFGNQLRRLQRMGGGGWVQDEWEEFCGNDPAI